MKKLIFDFDGTLVDSMPCWGQTMLSILESRGIPVPEGLLQIITPLGYGGTAEYFIRNFGMKESKEQLIAEMNERAYEGYATQIPAKQTVADTLQLLKSGGYSLNVLTASPHRTLDVCLTRLGLWELFDNVWSCDDFAATKADPKIYAMAASRLNTTVENCVFLDDNQNALRTAKTAGMPVVGVYDATSAGEIAEITHLCGSYIHRFAELPAILQQL